MLHPPADHAAYEYHTFWFDLNKYLGVDVIHNVFA